VAKQKTIVLGVTGSVAAYKSADLVRRLIEKGFKVSAIMTQEAERFITPLTLSSLGAEVHRGLFDGPMVMPHIDLAKQADLVVVAPATANIIGKFACGLADDLLTCVVLGTKAPILLVPAMNVEMYQNKIVQDNCAKLKKFGFSFIDPIVGKLACGDFGAGHIADVDEIVKKILKVVG